MAKDSRGHGSEARGSAKAERIAIMKRVDERSFPTRSTGDKVGALDQGIAKSGTANVINRAQAAQRAGLGVHSAGVHQVGQKPMTLASASAAGTATGAPLPITPRPGQSR